MYFRNLWLVFLFATSFSICFSQKADTLTTQSASGLYLKISYNSSLIYPGARAGAEFPFSSKAITKIKKAGTEKQFTKARLLTANLGWYHHPGFHDNVYLTAGFTARRIRPAGFFIGFTPEAGVSRTFIGGTTYRVDDDGNVSIEKLAGYYYALISAGAETGFDFTAAKRLPIMVFTKFNLIGMFPYNSTIYIRPAAEVGLMFKTSSLHLLMRAPNK